MQQHMSKKNCEDYKTEIPVRLNILQGAFNFGSCDLTKTQPIEFAGRLGWTTYREDAETDRMYDADED